MTAILDQLQFLNLNGWALPFADILLKSTVLLILATATNLLLRRNSAAVRHRIWCLTFCGLLGLPALAMLLPTWRLPILPDQAATSAMRQVIPMTPTERLSELHFTSSPQSKFKDPAPAHHAEAVALSESVASPAEVPAPPRSVEHLPVEQQTNHRFSSVPTSGTMRAQPSSAESDNSPAASFPWERVFGGVWLLGTCLAMWPLLRSLIRNTLLARDAQAVDDQSRLSLVDSLCHALGLRRPVRTLETDRRIVPMTWGVWRPIVMLPVAWREWSQQKTRLVLLHELAHVKRRDVAFQLIGRTACAVYWFHPLAWYALARLRIERELACDDCVLMTGARPSDYARELLEIARNYQPLALPATVAIAHTTNLEQRVRSLLDKARSHLPLSSMAGRRLFLCGLLFVLGLSVVRPVAREVIADSQAASSKGEAAEQSATEEKTPETRSTDRNQTQQAVIESHTTINVRGRVLLPDGQPAAGATVKAQLHRTSGDSLLSAILGSDYETPLTETTTEADGSFQIPLVTDPFGDLSDFGVEEERLRQYQEQWKSTLIGASLAGYGGQWVTYKKVEGEPEVVLQLVKDLPLDGSVVDSEGQPVAGAQVRLRYLSEDVRTHETRKVPELFDLISVDSPSTTDENGRFKVRGLGRERYVQIELLHESIAYSAIHVVLRANAFNNADDHRPPLYGAVFTHEAAQTRPFVGTVRDAETGEPLAGVSVESYRAANDKSRLFRELKTPTDAEGRFRLTNMPTGGQTRLVIVPAADQPYLVREVQIPTPPGTEPMELDIDLHRGVWITGRVTVKETGQPLLGLVHYFPYRTNEFAQALPEFLGNGYVHGAFGRDQEHNYTQRDGSFRIVGLPGPAIVGASINHWNETKYRQGIGYETLTGPRRNNSEQMDTYHMNSAPSPRSPTVMKEINVAPDAKSVEVNLEVDSGKSVLINVVGPSGEPLEAVTTRGESVVADGSQYRVEKLGPQESRTVIFQKDDLGGISRISAEDASPEGVTVKLQPMAKLTGRLHHMSGRPAGAVMVEARPLPLDPGGRPVQVRTNAEGEFEVELFPGADYEVIAQSGAGIFFPRKIRDRLTVEPGKTTDLGDLVIRGRDFVPVPDPLE